MSERPLVTAAMIVRDESAHLGACLASLQDVVDEIVVVDTGSSDDSPEIAASFGAKVVHYRWRHNFADARNVSLDESSGQWILYIDADERVVQGDRTYLGSLLADSSEVAYRLLLKPMLGTTAYREFRLWRNHPRIRFDGVIHEKVVPAIQRLSDEEGRGIGLADIVLQHVGYEGDQTRKHRRNLPLLREQLAAEPMNLFVWHHLFRVLEGLGETDEADRVLAQAVDVARTKAPGDRLGALLYADLIRRRSQRGEPVTALLDEARAAYPDNCVLIFLQGQELVGQGAYEEAIDRFDHLLSVNPSTLPPDSPAYDEQLFGELPLERRAFALFKIGRYVEAAEAYGEAEAIAPSNPAYRVKRQLAEARARRTEGSA